MAYLTLTNNPSIHVLNKIAAVLDVDLKILLGTESSNQVINQVLEQEWVDFVVELKEAGIGKEQLQEYRNLIEFIKWKSESEKGLNL